MIPDNDEVVTIDILPKESTQYHESEKLFAEGVNQHMAFLPGAILTTTEIKIEDIQVGEPGVPLTDDKEKLRQLICKIWHLLKGKCNALPPAARGAICDIGVGEGRGGLTQLLKGYARWHLVSRRNGRVN